MASAASDAACCARPSSAAPISRSSPSTTWPTPPRSPTCSPTTPSTAASPSAVRCRDGYHRDRRPADHRQRASATPPTLPWDELGVDVVIEATGRFRTRADAARHLEAGARKVILSAPAKGDEPADANLVLGVNDDAYDPEHHHILTNASCTTNCLAPVAMILHETVGIRHGLMTTIHAYTADQNLHDAPHKDLRRARAAAPEPDPHVHRRREGARARHPRARGQAARLRRARPAADGLDRRPDRRGRAADERRRDQRRLRRPRRHRRARRASSPTARTRSSPPTSSSRPYSAIFDAPLTSVIDGTQVKVVAWYDNEWGYANRLVDLAARVMVPVPAVV